MRAFTSLGWLLLLNGCSFFFSQGPPAGHEKMQYFDCNSNVAAPASDTASAVSNGLLAILINIDRSEYSASEKRSLNVPTVIFGTAAAIYLGSAIYGFSVCADCEEAKQALRERMDEREARTAKHVAELEQQLRQAAASRGCASDSECKADRICERGACVAPAATSAPAPAEPLSPAEPVAPVEPLPSAPPAP
jgi:hypothetical protein